MEWLLENPAKASLILAMLALTIPLLLRAVARRLARNDDAELRLEPAASGPADTLVVIVPGLPGLRGFQGALDLVAKTLPAADRLIVDYRGGKVRGYVSNADPYVIADTIEQAIHERCKHGAYQRVILFGYSAGAPLLRKALVWAHGHEEDRASLGRRGKRDWVEKLERVVLLAGMNRGWSVNPRPALMSRRRYWGIRVGKRIARLLGISGLCLAMHRGAPFVADTRVQWVRLTRSDAVVAGQQRFPQVVQLIGSEDDLVSKEDGQDLVTAAGTVFKTLPRTSHQEIGEAIDDQNDPNAQHRRHLIALALQGKIDELEPDRIELKEDREVTRLIYVMHGIRDWAEWTDRVRDEIERRCGDSSEKVVVYNAKYGYFPMARFLLSFDRQRNVRYFMDWYTEHVARYPNVRAVDFVGHSNGTYILAAALLRYVTINVRRVFFAGSVVRSDYPWAQLIENGRVERVVNVVASADWIVAHFPKAFEQVAELFGIGVRHAWFDLGGAGFNGFRDSGIATTVDDLKFAAGGHGVGVDVKTPDKLNAIAAYIMSDDNVGMFAFKGAQDQSGKLAFSSNFSIAFWGGLIIVLVQLGVLIYQFSLIALGTLAASIAVAFFIGAVLLALYFA